MVRLCQILYETTDGKKAICIDKANSKTILAYINQSKRHREKFLHIVELILGGHRYRELYDKEDINEKAKHVTAMKFFKGQENDRIYCKEQRTEEGIYIIVTAVIYQRKKTNKVSKKEISIINKIASYEYQIEKP